MASDAEQRLATIVHRCLMQVETDNSRSIAKSILAAGYTPPPEPASEVACESPSLRGRTMGETRRKGYSDDQYAKALSLLVEGLREYAPQYLADLAKGNSLIDEVEQFGKRGPVGLGLGRMGGHAVG